MENLIGQALEAIASMGLLVLLVGFIAFTFAGVVAKQIVKFFIRVGEIAFAHFALHVFLLTWQFASILRVLPQQKAQFLIAWRK